MPVAIASTKYRTPEPALLEQRQHQRHPVFIQKASVRGRRAKPVEAALQDVSIYGCKLACAKMQPAEARVWLRIHNGMPIAATVVWAKDGMVGCRFDAPISSGTVRALTLGR